MSENQIPEADLGEYEKLLLKIFGTVKKKSEGPVDPNKLTGLKKALSSVLDSLTERERKVMEQRFGLDGDSKSLEEIGKQFKIASERIRQIEAKALRKMRHPARIRQLDEFLGKEPPH